MSAAKYGLQRLRLPTASLLADAAFSAVALVAVTLDAAVLTAAAPTPDGWAHIPSHLVARTCNLQHPTSL